MNRLKHPIYIFHGIFIDFLTIDITFNEFSAIILIIIMTIASDFIEMFAIHRRYKENECSNDKNQCFIQFLFI